jgi:hypothetical protein
MNITRQNWMGANMYSLFAPMMPFFINIASTAFMNKNKLVNMIAVINDL